MSIMIDKKHIRNNIKNQKNTFLTTPTLQPLIWVCDNKVEKCHSCDIYFSFIKRRHHCRLCGRIFCGSCCFQYVKIPELLHKITDQSWWFFDSEKQLLCQKCYLDVNIIYNFPQEFYMFLNIPLTIKEIFKLRSISKKWCQIINLIILRYKRIQYFLPCQPISNMEQIFLWNHRFEYLNHPELMYKLLSRTKSYLHKKYISELSKKKIFTCREVLCNRNCLHQTKIEHIFEWLYSQDRNSDILPLILKNIDNINNYDFLNMLPLILNFGSKFPELYDTIVTKCIINPKLTFDLYFHFRLLLNIEDDMAEKINIQYQYDHFIELIPKNDRNKIENTYKFIEKLEYIQKIENIVEINEWIYKNDIYIPWDQTLKCLSILPESFEVISSNTRPIKIGILVKTKYSHEMIVNILIKKEDIRKDFLSMIISKCINKICHKHVNIPVYNIIPIHSKFGIIEMVNNVVSLYDISKKYNTTLYKYIMEINPEQSINNIRKNFISSCVGSCILSYMLGLGDRHLENILLSSEGKIFHIDFDYILGEDPKNVSVEMMITEDMLEMLGGKNSVYFKTFQTECKQSYIKIRQRNNLWYFIFMHLHKKYPEKYSKEYIEYYLIDKLVPGESNKSVNTEIVNIIQHSSNSYFSKYVTNWTHEISKELGKIGSYLNLKSYFQT